MKAGFVLAACFLLSAPWEVSQTEAKSSLASPDHAIYIGVIQVLHKDRAEKATVNVKIFKDDMQNALRNAFENYEVIPLDDICARQEDLLADYFAEHLLFSVNGKAVKTTLENCSVENDVYWLTFDMPCPAQWNKLSVEADFFMELFPTQSNMVSLHHGEERRFFRLTKGEAEEEVVF